MLTYEEALALVQTQTPRPQAARCRLEDAQGLTLARSVAARCDLPRFDNSAVDGYAVAVAQPTTSNRPTDPSAGGTFKIVGTSEAGRSFRGRIKSGEAVRILTGATIPRGADAVIMQEDVTRDAGHIATSRLPTPGQHIRRRREEMQRGDVALLAGGALRPSGIGLLAALGHKEAVVYRRPMVDILVTGDELRAPGSRLNAGEIYESNGALLAALVRQNGGEDRRLGIVIDKPAPLAAAIRRGLTSDLLLISGGVSVGDRDFVRAACAACGVREVFWRVNIKPGMPLFFGKRGRTLVFGLPGNPVSVFVTFEAFVKPAIRRLMGMAWRDEYVTPAILDGGLHVSTNRRTHFIRVQSQTGDDGLIRVRPVGGQGSHHLRSLATADGWIRVNSDAIPQVGDVVQIKREPASPDARRHHPAGGDPVTGMCYRSP